MSCAGIDKCCCMLQSKSFRGFNGLPGRKLQQGPPELPAVPEMIEPFAAMAPSMMAEAPMTAPGMSSIQCSILVFHEQSLALCCRATLFSCDNHQSVIQSLSFNLALPCSCMLLWSALTGGHLGNEGHRITIIHAEEHVRQACRRGHLLSCPLHLQEASPSQAPSSRLSPSRCPSLLFPSQRGPLRP